jgi:hypothetical protein
MNSVARVTALLVLGTARCLAQSSNSSGGGAAKLEAMPRSLEERLALSALPPHLRDAATTYVLDPASGYVLNRQGTNGFSCIVMRTEWEWPQLPFRDDIFVPICYDEEGSKKMLPVWMDVAKMRAQGLSPVQVHQAILKKFSDRIYQKPARPGISYMTAPLMRSYPAPNATEVTTMVLPHYMFYAPNLKNEDIGGNPGSQYPFILPQGPGPHDVIILLVGETEKAKILADSSDMLKELCAYRKSLCVGPASSGHH